MGLKDQISSDIKAALLGGNRFEGETLRNLKAAILNEEVAQGKRDEGLAEVELEKIIAREIKKRKESAKMYRDNNRTDLAEPEEKEAEIFAKYLPEQLSEDDIRDIVAEITTDIGEVSMQQMGQVIGAVKQKVGNSADGALIAKVVKESLQK